MIIDFNSININTPLITELTDKYNATTDYVSLNKDLERFQDSLVDRYLRWR